MAKITAEYLRELLHNYNEEKISEDTVLKLLNEKASEQIVPNAYAVRNNSTERIVNASVRISKAQCKSDFMKSKGVKSWATVSRKGFECIPVIVKEFHPLDAPTI